MSKFDLTPRKNVLAPLVTLNLDCQEYAADLEAQAQLQMEAEALHCACLAKNRIGISLYTQQWFCDSAISLYLATCLGYSCIHYFFENNISMESHSLQCGQRMFHLFGMFLLLNPKIQII